MSNEQQNAVKILRRVLIEARNEGWNPVHVEGIGKVKTDQDVIEGMKQVDEGTITFEHSDTKKRAGALIVMMNGHDALVDYNVSPGFDTAMDKVYEWWEKNDPAAFNRNPIKRPGKFEGETYAARYAYENPDDDLGDSETFNWYGRFSGRIKGRGPFYIIVEETSQGFVNAEFFGSETALNNKWEELQMEWESFNE